MSFWCHRFDQNTKEIFLKISALASKKSSNKKSSKGILFFFNYLKIIYLSMVTRVLT